MSWATERARLLGTVAPMALDDVFTALLERDAVLYVEDEQLRYAGPDLAPNDPLQAGINEHRPMLLELFTYAPGGRCVMAPCLRLVAPDDLTLCPDHRAERDALVMPWEEKTDV